MSPSNVQIRAFVAVPHWERSYAGGFDFNWDVSVRGFAPAFQVQSQDAEGMLWTDLLVDDTGAPAPVTVPFVAGVGPRQLSFQGDGHFRLVVFDAATPGIVAATSRPVDARNQLTRADWLRYREMLRRERLQLEKLTGLPAFLLRRIVYGTFCPDCRDPATGEVSSTECAACYGTGFVGGYYPPFPVFADWDDPPGSGGDTTSVNSEGPNEDKRSSAMLLAFPGAKFQDVLVDRGTGERHVVDENGVQAVSFHGAPIKQIVKLSRLAPSDPAYGVPVPGL